MTPGPDAEGRPAPFGTRMADAVAAHGSLVVGIDPHPGLLADWGLADSARGARELSLRVIDALGGRVAAFKPQSAFFEAYGSAGVAVLEEVLAASAQAGTLTILDAKRGDIGSTMSAYARAYLTEGAPLGADALTVSPYLGPGSLAEAADVARAAGRGLFVLALTSNPEAPALQHLGAPGASVASLVTEWASARNAGETGGAGPGSVGLVVGATVGEAPERLGLDLAGAGGWILVPGLGAQGGTAADVRRALGGAAPRALLAASRSVLSAGPGADGLRAAARRTTLEATPT